MKQLIFSATTAAALALITLAPVAQAQNLLTNPGFETGDFAGWNTSNLNATFVAPFGFDGYPTHNGNFFAALGNVGSPGTLSQTIATTPGTTYDFSVYLASNGTSNVFGLAIDGNYLMPLQYIPAQGYTLYSVSAVATGNSTTFTVAEQDNPSYIALDDASVVAANSSVPEPGAYATIASLGLAGIGFLRRRRAR